MEVRGTMMVRDVLQFYLCVSVVCFVSSSQPFPLKKISAQGHHVVRLDGVAILV